MTRRKSIFVLISVMLISLLGTAGIALPYPVLAPYFLDMPANSLTHFMGFHPKALLGFSLAIYPLGLLVGSIFIGALSDHYGRRKVLLWSLLGSLLGYLATALAVIEESFVGFIAARFVTGLCEGNIAIARAIAAELHPHVERTKAISLVYAANYAGWLLGPLIGGFMIVYGVANVFNIAGLGILIAVVLVFLTIDKEFDTEKQQTSLVKLLRYNNSLTLLKNKQVLPIFWFYFLYSMGLNAFYDFYPVWFVDYLDASSESIAWATVALTSCMIMVSSFFVDKLNFKFGELKLMLYGAVALSLLLFFQPFIGQQQVYPLFFIIGGLIAVANGMVPTYLSKYFGHLGQGKVMGLQITTFCLTNVIIASVGGVLSIVSSKLILLIGAALVAGSVLVILVTRKQQQLMIAEHHRLEQKKAEQKRLEPKELTSEAAR